MKKMDLTKIEPILNESSTPAGNNSLDPKRAYFEKKSYELKSFRTGFVDKNKPINILYDKLFYGRVDLDNEPVVVDSAKIITKINSQGEEVSLMNFVSDAYTDFMNEWRYLKKINKLDEGGKFYNISAKISWIEPGRMYYFYVSSLYNALRDRINSKKIKIKNFDQFIDEFVDFIDVLTPENPFLFSSFIRSKMADPSISGMCLDVNILDLTNDRIKFTQIFEDPNFQIFKKTAMKFGFMVDKHIPWRLYADIDSPAMQPYMQKYQLTQDNIYQTNFISAADYDLELLRIYLIQFYNTFISNEMVIKEPEFKICKKTGTTIVKYKEYNLNFLNIEQIKTDIEFDRYFMKLYVYIKAREQNYSWDNGKFKTVVNTFIEIKEVLDTQRAMSYIRPLVKLPAISDHKQRSFHFR